MSKLNADGELIKADNCHACGERLYAGEHATEATITQSKRAAVGTVVLVCGSCCDHGDAEAAELALRQAAAKDRAERVELGEISDEDSPCIDWQGFDRPSTY